MERDGERLVLAVRKDGDVSVERLDPSCGDGRRGVAY